MDYADLYYAALLVVGSAVCTAAVFTARIRQYKQQLAQQLADLQAIRLALQAIAPSAGPYMPPVVPAPVAPPTSESVASDLEMLKALLTKPPAKQPPSPFSAMRTSGDHQRAGR